MKQINGHFYGQNIISVEQFSKDDIETVFQLTTQYKKGIEEGSVYADLSGKILAALFYEPSSRTFSSFIAAMQRLGGGFIPLSNMANTSSAKGESIEDTVRVFSKYADALVVRHFEAGVPEMMSRYAEVPVINAGDGATGEHPTQALLDAYTIKDNFGVLDGLNIVMVGDLAHYRGVNSLAKLMTLYPKTKLYFVSPPVLKITNSLRTYLKKRKATFFELEDLNKVIKLVDVLNVTRLKKEYISEHLYKQLQNSYVIDIKTINRMKKKSIIIHNLPRIWEIVREVDRDERAVYLSRQVRNGLFIRMALLRLILKK